MFKNYFKTAIRNILRNKIYSFLNIFGLSISMAFCILVFAYIYHERSFNKFNENSDWIYRVITEKFDKDGNSFMKGPETGIQLSSVLSQEYPEIEKSMMYSKHSGKFTYKDKLFFEKNGFKVSKTFFEVFKFDISEGSCETALRESNSLIFTKKTAEKYFINEDPLGKIIRIADIDYKITAIIDKIPANSDLQFDYLISNPPVEKDEYYNFDQWWFGNANTFVILRKGSSPQNLETKFSGLIEKYCGEAKKSRIKLHLQPIADMHLYSNFGSSETGKSNLNFIYLLSISAIFILLIACINYINISIGLFSTRVKEIGIRKTIGATRFQILKQFSGEILIQCIFAILLGISIAELVLPAFKELVKSDFTILYNISTFGYLISLVIFSGIVSGGATSLILVRLKSADIFRTNIKIGGFNLFNKTLVILQFSLSIFFVVITIIMFQQLHYMKSQDKGYNSGKFIIIPVYNWENYSANKAILSNLRAELQNYGQIMDITGSSYYIDNYNGSILLIKNDDWQYSEYGIDQDYFKTLGIRIKKGRNFSSEYPADYSNSIIVNEEFVKAFKLDDPIGKPIDVIRGTPGTKDRSEKKEVGKTIIGVVENFNFESLHKKIEPAMFSLDWATMAYFIVKINPEKTTEAINILKKKFTEIAPGVPFEYTFLNDDINKIYGDEERMQKIFQYSSLLVIIISCLGVLGLTGLSINKRKKEISIRKIFGASSFSILKLLSKKYFALILIASIFGWAAGYCFITGWLQNFAYRVEITWWIFALSGLMMLFIAMLTISWQTWRAVMEDPIKSLKYE